MIVGDIDEGITIDDFLKLPIAKFCLVYTSPSHTPNHHKFRIICFLPSAQGVSGEVYEKLLQIVDHLVGGYLDPAAMESGRMFYGNERAIVYNDNPFELPNRLIIEAEKLLAQEKEEREKVRQHSETKKEARQSDPDFDIDSSEIEKALAHINPDCDYTTWLNIGFALFNQFDGSDDGFGLYDRWSSVGTKYAGTENLKFKWQSFGKDKPLDNQVTIASLFKIAIESGYKPPYKGNHFLEDLTKYTAKHTISDDDLIDTPSGKKLAPESFIELVNQHKLVSLKGSKGLGKSVSIKSLVKKYDAQGIKTVLLGSRRGLTRRQCFEFGLAYFDGKSSKSIEQLFKENRGVGIVIDSFPKLKGVDFSDKIIIIDESEQFFKHVITSKTHIKNNRGAILSDLEKGSTQAHGLILSDADSSNIANDWYENLSGRSIFTCEYRGKNQESNCLLFDKENQLIAETIRLLENGKRLNVVSDSKKDLEALMMEVNKRIPSLVSHVELITSDTTTEQFTQTFMNNPDFAIKQNKVYCLMFSPVAQSGISIDARSFDVVIGFCFGIVEPSIMRQLLMRYREFCDRYLYIAKTPKARYEKIFDYKEILKNNIHESIMTLTNYRKELVNNGGGHLLDELESVLKKINPEATEDYNLIAKAKLKARYNCLMSNYRENLINELTKEGYNVSSFAGSCRKEIDTTENKETLVKEFGKLVFDSHPLPKDELTHFEPKDKEDNAILTKTIIVETLPKLSLSVELITALFLKENWKNVKAIKRFWYAKHPEHTRTSDIKALNHAVKSYQKCGKIWFDDYKFNSHFLKLYEVLGLDSFLVEGITFNQNSDSIRLFFDRCQKHR